MNKSFTPKKVWSTNQKDALSAEKSVDKKTEEECMRQFVHNAALRQKFLLNLLRAKKSIARNAIKNDKVNLMFKISSHLLKVAFLILNQSQRVF